MTSLKSSAPPLLFHLYRGVTALLAPFAFRKVAGKLAAHGVTPVRQRERLGYASQPRPTPMSSDDSSAPLLWFHGASVGESLAALSLIDKLAPRLPRAEFLLTSGTASSAEMMAKRMPARCRHQFAPLDSSTAVQRFLRHWQPDAALFVESELWPVTLDAAKHAGVRLALVNARLSDRSVERWKSKPATAAFVMQKFDILLSQNPQMGQTLIELGADAARVHPSGNLKAGSAPLPVDKQALDDLRSALGTRPAWIASSTHQGEEETVIAAHKALLAEFPALCLLLAPRHPERAEEITTLIRKAGLSMARRSEGQPLTADTQIYLADTLGEVGTWYALSPIVFLGGSLAPIGGHNPFEVAQAGAAVITGPGYSNFAETFPPLIAAGGAVEVTDASTLAKAVQNWLQDPTALTKARAAAHDVVTTQAAALEGVVDLLIDHLALAPAAADN
ncbi:3-deoxy-D-manno-octulosonic acid transferase [Phaeobacter porticola]|uniref:3-deoxy-D-manno-octulosonic acid transferase n=1 Tax=Phaeobacter porticola TaxID=1844006 RepID=A0A1L3I2Z4_9RHOB|nr:3-deoxy-D-manno-octulosonic acid transferase [Phaeobacter porticola]APG46417.1 3-deoxy-D-manno-octulosonic-acid transferase [Phaeobacter porticola]